MSLRPSKRSAESNGSKKNSNESDDDSKSFPRQPATDAGVRKLGWVQVAAISVVATLAVQFLALKLLGGSIHIPAIHKTQSADTPLTAAKLFEIPNTSDLHQPATTVSAIHKEVATSTASAWEKRDVKFLNNYEETVDLFWVNNAGAESKMDSIPPGEMRPFSSYKNHVWSFRRSRDQVLLRSVVIGDTTLVKVHLDGASQFAEDYEKRNGRPWLNVYPRGPTVFPIFDPVKIGHQFTVSTSAPFVTDANAKPEGSGPSFTITTLSTSPKVFSVPGFLSEYECEYIKESAIKSNKLKRSGVNTDYTIHPSRTSSSVFLEYDASSMVFTQISRRGFEVLGIPGIPDNYTKVAENLQVIHYGHAQEYSPHHDYFDPFQQVYLKDPAIQRGANRFATLLFYLNDVEEGGETVFPSKDGEYTAQPCEKGFRVRPKKGDAVLFYSMLADGNLDERSLHGGCPVKKGEKWAANWWFWDPYRRSE